MSTQEAVIIESYLNPTKIDVTESGADESGLSPNAVKTKPKKRRTKKSCITAEALSPTAV